MKLFMLNSLRIAAFPAPSPHIEPSKKTFHRADSSPTDEATYAHQECARDSSWFIQPFYSLPSEKGL